MVKTTPWRINIGKGFMFDLAKSVIDQPTPKRGKRSRSGKSRESVKRGKRSAWAEIRAMAGLRP